MIKKKYNWTTHTGPRKPNLIKKPSKTIDKSILIYQGSSFSLKDIEIPKEYLDKGYSLDDLIFSISNNGCYGECECVLDVELITEATNDKYEKQLAKYEQEKKVHEVELKVWQKENEQWELWKKQEEDKILQKRLDQAENLLKEHNKI